MIEGFSWHLKQAETEIWTGDSRQPGLQQVVMETGIEGS